MIDEAIARYQKALQLNPGLADAYNNLGVSLMEKGQVIEAMACYRKALKVDAHFANAHFNLSLALLLEGRFKEGWDEYEWRWLTEEYVKQKKELPLPMWDGSPLHDKSILVFAEQGVGDEIMFASCLPEIVAEAKQCIVETDKRLIPLFMRSFPGAKFLERSQTIGYSPEVSSTDLKIAMGSLPKFLRPTLASFPKRKAFLIPDVSLVVVWRDRYKKLGDGLKLGISWRGGSTRATRRTRSTILKQWAGLFSLQQVHFINLQYGECKDELKEAKESLGVIIHDWDDVDPLKNLDFFAAQIAALDLIISVDNATVHMAGALGIPVWTLLPFTCDWRWMQDFAGTPWYPTMRLFRQDTYGEWDGVFEHIYYALIEATEIGTTAPNIRTSDINSSRTSLPDSELPD